MIALSTELAMRLHDKSVINATDVRAKLNELLNYEKPTRYDIMVSYDDVTQKYRVALTRTEAAIGGLSADDCQALVRLLDGSGKALKIPTVIHWPSTYTGAKGSYSRFCSDMSMVMIKPPRQ